MNEEFFPSTAAPSDEEGGHRRLIEIGWVLAGRLDAADYEAVVQAREEVLAYLRKRLPRYEWEMPLARREEMGQGRRHEPVELLDQAVEERNIRRWDFVLVIAAADLVSHYQPYALAAVSRSLEAAVISTSRIDPKATGESADHDRVAVLARRIKALVLHSLGDLFNLPHADDPQNYMTPFETIEDLDRRGGFSDEQLAEADDSLAEVADRRLEEQSQFHGARRVKFYLYAAWINRGEIASALIGAKPWQFPFRLSRLTTAAVSATLILAMTAEVWELGMSQDGWFVAVLSVVTILATTCYVLARQRLLLRRERARLSEQRVVTNVSTFAIVLAGMAATYVFLAIAILAVSLTFFSATLVRNWAASEQDPIEPADYGVLVAFVASLGLVIGALGASFESQHYFRHVTHVDEEI